MLNTLKISTLFSKIHVVAETYRDKMSAHWIHSLSLAFCPGGHLGRFHSYGSHITLTSLKATLNTPLNMRSGRKLTQKKILWIYWQSTWQPQSPSGTIGQLAADEDTSWCYNIHTAPSGGQGTFTSYHAAVKDTDNQSHWNETNWCQIFSKRFVSFSATFSSHYKCPGPRRVLFQCVTMWNHFVMISSSSASVEEACVIYWNRDESGMTPCSIPRSN